jgi:transcriptional regulator with XRE-family HTH domain
VRDQVAAILGRCIAHRKAQNLSQAEIARRMMTTPNHITKLERGTSDVRLSTFIRYANAVGLDIEVRER